MDARVKMMWEHRMKLCAHADVKGKAVLSAYNVVIDCRKFVVSSFLRKHRKLLKVGKKVPNVLNSEADFFAALADCIKNGKSNHVYFSKAFAPWLENLPYNDKALGGQAGIIANQLAMLGARSLLYSPMLSRESEKLLNGRVLLPVVENGGGKLRVETFTHLRHYHPYLFSGATKVNYIFEFPKGLRLKLQNGDVFHAPRSNRMIVASELDYFPSFSEAMIEFLPELGEKLDAAVFAGYHYAAAVSKSSEALEREEKILKLLKTRNKKLMVHWEYVPAGDKKIEKKIINLVSNHIDSFGINEKEIAGLLREFGFEKEAQNIEEFESAISLWKGGEKVLDVLKLKRLHLHNLGYYILLLDKGHYNLHGAMRVVDAALFSSTPATSKAMLGRELRSRRELNLSLNVGAPDKGFDQLEKLGLFLARYKSTLKLKNFNYKHFLMQGIAEFPKYFLLCVPVKFVQSPKATVGIGDVVSSTTLLAEV